MCVTNLLFLIFRLAWNFIQPWNDTHFSLQKTFHFNTFSWQSSRYEHYSCTYDIHSRHEKTRHISNHIITSNKSRWRGLPAYCVVCIEWNVSVSIIVFARQWGVIYLPLKRNLHVLNMVYLHVKETRLTVVCLILLVLLCASLEGSTLIILHIVFWTYTDKQIQYFEYERRLVVLSFSQK